MIIKEKVNRIVKREIGREIHLDIGNGRVLEYYKYSKMDESAEIYESGCEHDSDSSREIFDSLSEDDQQDIEDYLDAVEL